LAGKDVIEVSVAHGKDPYRVVEEALDGLERDPNLGFVFFSPDHVDDIEDAVSGLPDGCRTVGCSTAGELTPEGYTSGSVVVALLSSPYLSVETHSVRFEREETDHARELGRRLMVDAMASLRKPGPCVDLTFNAMLRSIVSGKPVKTLPYFAIELVEGLAPAIDYYMDGINDVVRKYKFLEVFGGAAGDDLRLERTYVMKDGELQPEWSAVVAFGITSLKIGGYLDHGFDVVEEDVLFVTEAVPEERRIVSFDGEPAAEAYAEMVGEDPENLDDSVFMWNPLGWEITTGQVVVREPAFVDEDGSMVFHSRPPRYGGFVRLRPTEENMYETAKRVTEVAMRNAEIEDPDEVALVLVFDCAHRDCDAQYEAIREVVGDDVPIVGFKTYGEHGQLRCGTVCHCNQTIQVVVLGNSTVSQAV